MTQHAGVDSEPAYRPGSAEDFDRLYRASYKRLLYTLLGVLRDRAAAEDCVQETIARGFAAWSRWKPDAPA
ncbi:MAG: RNA polymerase sigma factor, partial [Candidatus Dormibacteria bacterium]